MLVEKIRFDLHSCAHILNVPVHMSAVGLPCLVRCVFFSYHLVTNMTKASAAVKIQLAPGRDELTSGEADGIRLLISRSVQGLDVENVALDVVLKHCLDGSGLSYRKVENTLVIVPAETRAFSPTSG